MFEVPDIYVPVARIWSSDRAVPVPPAVSGGGGVGQRPAWGAAGPQEVGRVGTDRRLGRGGADRRLEPVRTAVSPSGRWRLAYPLAVSLAGGGLLLAMVPSGVRALLAAPRPIAVLGALTLVAALVPSLAAHARGARPSPTDLEPGALAQPFGFAVLLGWAIAACRSPRCSCYRSPRSTWRPARRSRRSVRTSWPSASARAPRRPRRRCWRPSRMSCARP